MKFLYPATINNTSLAFSNVPETEYAAYSSGTFYPTESFVIFEHYIYQAIAASTGARPDISPTSWTVIGPTNAWAMFDLTRGTSTVATGDIVVGMQLDQVDAMSMINVVGDSVQVTVDQGGVVYDRTITLAGMQSIYLDDLPPSDGAGILVVISGATTGIASLQAGRVFTMGETLHPLGFSITDYSRKDTDEFGNTNLTRRGFSRRTDAKVLVESSNIDECVRLLAGIRATPVVWIATTKYSSAFVLGYYKDWTLDIASHAHAECSISIEGMTEDGLFSYADIIRPGGSISMSAFEDDDVATSTFNGISELASSLSEDDDVASAAVVGLWEFAASMAEDDDEATGSVVSIPSFAMYAVEDDDDVSASFEPPTPSLPVSDNLVFELLANQYSSGQTLANTVAAPSDGAAQTDYDWVLGANSSSSSDDPTFSSSGEPYFEFDGGDYFTLSGASTAFLKAMHKTGSKFTIEIWAYIPSAGGGNINPFFDTGSHDGGGTDVSRAVVYLDQGNLNTSGGLHSFRVKGDGGLNTLSVQSDSPTPKNQIVMLAISFDGSGAENSFLYCNGSYDPVGGNNTWNGTMASPSSSDPVNSPRIGARGDGAFKVPNGNRLYGIRVYDTNLTKSQLDQNYAAGVGSSANGTGSPAAPKWTLSESYPSGAWTLTNSDATATEGTGSQTSIRCDTPISGKRYWECVVSTTTSGTFDAFTGVVATEVAGSNSAFNVGNLIRVRSNGTTWGVGTASGVVGYSDGDVLMFAMDPDAKKIWVGKNGTWMNSGDPAAGTGPAFTYTVDGKTWVPEFGSDNNGTDHRVVGHFTSDSVQYAIPAGFTVLGS